MPNEIKDNASAYAGETLWVFKPDTEEPFGIRLGRVRPGSNEPTLVYILSGSKLRITLPTNLCTWFGGQETLEVRYIEATGGEGPLFSIDGMVFSPLTFENAPMVFVPTSEHYNILMFPPQN